MTAIIATHYFIRVSRGAYRCVGVEEGGGAQVMEWKVKNYDVSLSNLTAGQCLPASGGSDRSGNMIHYSRTRCRDGISSLIGNMQL